MRLGWLTPLAVLATVHIAGCSSSSPSNANANARDERPETTKTITQAVQGGVVDTTHKYAVGVCNGAGCFRRCSGALILPNLVATARHCVDASPEKISCAENPSFGARHSGGFFITTNDTLGQYDANDPNDVSVQSVVVPPDSHICGNDIALLILSNAVSPAVAKPITPDVQYLMWDPAHFVPVFTAIGYGNTAVGAQDSGTRRRRELISVFCIPGDLEHAKCPNGPPPENIDPISLISPKEFIGGSGTCSGDSGSSAYEQQSFDANAPVSFGVLSRGGEDGTTCSGSVYTRFDAHRDFILQTAKSASGNWASYPEPSWTGAPVAPAVKDGGAPTPKKDSGVGTTPTSAALEIGEACTTESDCASNICADLADGSSKVCSQDCDPAEPTSCPDGFKCSEGLLCLPATVGGDTPAGATKTTTSGCAAGSSPTPDAGWAAGLLVGVIAVLASKRRRRD